VRPVIGMIDSGVGGLAVLREVRALLPNADLVYLADQARAPYGERSLDEVREAAGAAASHLLSLGADAVVVACNTASAAALGTLRADHPGVPFVGMEPAVKPAAAATSSNVVGVLATPVTFQAEVFEGLVGRFAEGIEVIPTPCPGWASLVEDDGVDAAPGVIARRIGPLLDAGADTLVLACTHYTFLSARIAAAAGPDVTIIDPAGAVARQVVRIADETGGGTTTFLTTGDPARFAAQLERLLGIDASPVGVAF
jgi:glutamate racemase